MHLTRRAFAQKNQLVLDAADQLLLLEGGTA